MNLEAIKTRCLPTPILQNLNYHWMKHDVGSPVIVRDFEKLVYGGEERVIVDNEELDKNILHFDGPRGKSLLWEKLPWVAFFDSWGDHDWGIG